MAADTQDRNEDRADSEGIKIPHTISLLYPFDWTKEEKVTEITFERRLKAKDFKNIKASDITFNDMMVLISKASNEPIRKIEELDSEDLFQCVEVVNSFLPDSPQTGGR